MLGADTTRTPLAVSGWVPVTSMLLALAGLGVAAYLTIEHDRRHHPGLPGNRVVNCQKVTTSAQSPVAGILDAVCRWCTAVHVITVALFAVIVFAAAVAEPAS